MMTDTDFEYVELRIPAWQVDLTDLVAGIRVDGYQAFNQYAQDGQQIPSVRLTLEPGVQMVLHETDEIVVARRRRCSVCPAQRAEWIVTACDDDDPDPGGAGELGVLLCDRDAETARLHNRSVAPLP